MADVLEKVEYAAWQLAAEPVPWRMDMLLRLVWDSAAEIAEVPKDAMRASESAVGVDLTTMPKELPETPWERSGERLGVSGAEVHNVKRVSGRAVTPDTGDEDVPKTCKVCSRELTRGDFQRDASRSDGRRHSCRDCTSAARKRERDRRKGHVMPPAGGAA